MPLVRGASPGMADTHSTCNKFASTSGSDGAGNGSFANPDATPQKLVDPLPGGQRGCFRRGTYNFSVTEVNSPDVTLAPYDRESVTLNGTFKFLPSSAGSAIRRLKLDYHNRTDGSGGSPRIYADDVLLRHSDITSDHIGTCRPTMSSRETSSRALRRDGRLWAFTGRDPDGSNVLRDNCLYAPAFGLRGH